MIGRVCDEFHCLPSQAIRELDNDPDRTALAILEIRAFERTWRAIDQARSQADVPNGPMAERVLAVMGDRLTQRSGGATT